jgi:hypothetical protein
VFFARLGARFLRFVAFRWSRVKQNFIVRSKQTGTRRLRLTRRTKMNTRLNKDNTLMSTLLAAGLLMVLAAPLVNPAHTADNAANSAARHAVDNAAMDSARRATDVVPTAPRNAVENQPAIIVSAPRLARTA